MDVITYPCSNRSWSMSTKSFPLPFTSILSYDCPYASKVTSKFMGKYIAWNPLLITWILRRQKRVSMTRISNYIPQWNMGCNYLSKENRFWHQNLHITTTIQGPSCVLCSCLAHAWRNETQTLGLYKETYRLYLVVSHSPQQTPLQGSFWVWNQPIIEGFT